MSNFVQFNSEVGSRVLYTPCERVEDISSQRIQELILRMQKEMRAHGIGLAANQVGESLQLFMFEYQPPQTDEEKAKRSIFAEIPFQVFINPKITRASVERVRWWHGCLSAAEYPRGEVATYKWIEIEAYNGSGEKITSRIEDLAAVIFQHEFRHLLGGVYLDYARETLSEEEYQTRREANSLRLGEECGEEVPFLLPDYLVGESIDEYRDRMRREKPAID